MFTVKKSKKIKKRILFTISIAIQLITVLIVLINYFSFTNTLANNKKWQVTKSQLFIPGDDADDFINKLPALAKNSLNPSAWRGFHEVILKEPVPWKNLTLNFLPSKNSYLYIIFHKNDRYFSAIRISYSPLYRSALISAKYTGEFIEYIPISIPQLNGSSWQEISLKKSDSKSQIIEFWYNGELVTRYLDRISTEGNIGFRTGKNELLIDNIKIENDAGQVVFTENFNGFENFWLKFSISVLLLGLLDFLFYLKLKNKDQIFESIIQLNFTACLLFFIVNFILFIFNSKLRARYFATADHSEIQEIVFMKEKDEEMFSVYENKNKNQTRIMIIGSSQTSGEGITLKGDDFVSQFEQLINQDYFIHKKSFEVINAGRDGNTSEYLFTYFKNQWLKLKPDVVIINLSSNDEEYENGFNFKKYLEKFIHESKKNNFKLIFVAEAISTEYKDTLKTHKIMQEVATKNQITFIDMHDHLTNLLEEGIIWWDFVHPTSFGYKLIANHLYESLKTELID